MKVLGISTSFDNHMPGKGWNRFLAGNNVCYLFQ